MMEWMRMNGLLSVIRLSDLMERAVDLERTNNSAMAERPREA